MSHRTQDNQTRYITTAAGGATAANSPAFTDGLVLSSAVERGAGLVNGLLQMGRQRGVLIFPFGSGSDGGTFTIKVWRYHPHLRPSSQDGTSNDIVSFQRTLLTTIVCTLSTAVGAAGGLLSATERYADTVVVTHSAACTTLCTAANVPVPSAHSPADDTPGFVAIPDVCDGAFVVLEFLSFTSVTAANAVIEQTR